MSDGTDVVRIDYGRDVETVGLREFVTRQGGVDQGAGARSPIIRDGAEYGRALDSLVVTCVDVLVVDGLQVLLGLRQHEPHPGWWVLGGRMQHGETFGAAARRNMLRETTIVPVSDRLRGEPVGVYSLIWDTREQAPQSNGCHMISVLMMYSVEPGEFDGAHFNDEYSKVAWVQVSDILAGGKWGDYHPALVQMVLDYMTNVFVPAVVDAQQI